MSKIKFAETLRRLIDESPYAHNRTAIWKSLNISSAALSQYLSGSSRPRFEVLVDLAKFFDVSLDELVLGKRSGGSTSDESRSLIHHVVWSLDDMRGAAGQQAWLVSRVGEVLASRLKEEVDRVARAESYAGMFTDREILILESHSTDTGVITRSLEFDLVKSGDEILPGRFGGVVAQNIQHDPPRRYRFLVDQRTVDTGAARDFLRVLSRLVDGDAEILKRVEIRAALQPIFGAMTYLKLDREGLRLESPVLAANAERFTTEDGHLVLHTASNRDLAGDYPCDPVEASELLGALEKTWETAIPVTK